MDNKSFLDYLYSLFIKIEISKNQFQKVQRKEISRNQKIKKSQIIWKHFHQIITLKKYSITIITILSFISFYKPFYSNLKKFTKK